MTQSRLADLAWYERIRLERWSCRHSKDFRPRELARWLNEHDRLIVIKAKARWTRCNTRGIASLRVCPESFDS